MSDKGNLSLNARRIRTGAEILRAMAHPFRLQILATLAETDAMHVQAIADHLSAQQSVISQQLRILRLAGLVSTLRQGKFVYYRLNETRFETALRISKILANTAHQDPKRKLRAAAK